MLVDPVDDVEDAVLDEAQVDLECLLELQDSA